MAKDDYFVIAYRILDYLYQCFKLGAKPDIFSIYYDVFEIEYKTWMEIIGNLQKNGHIIFDEPVRVNAISKRIRITSMRITQKGIEFLMDNSERFSKETNSSEAVKYFPYCGQRIS